MNNSNNNINNISANIVADINIAIDMLNNIKSRIEHGDIIIVRNLLSSISGTAGCSESVKIEFDFMQYNP